MSDKVQKIKQDEQEGKVLFEKSSGDCPKELIDIIDKEFGIDGRDENNNPLNGYGDWQRGMILNGPSIVNLVKLGVEWQKQQDEKLFNDDSWNYIEENYPNISQEEKLRLYDISIKSRLAGANAIKQKMVKDAVNATILDIDAQTIEFGLWPEKLLDIKEGDKVKIIVIKEN
jgi:hypothetical protein